MLVCWKCSMIFHIFRHTRKASVGICWYDISHDISPSLQRFRKPARPCNWPRGVAVGPPPPGPSPWAQSRAPPWGGWAVDAGRIMFWLIAYMVANMKHDLHCCFILMLIHDNTIKMFLVCAVIIVTVNFSC